MRGSGIIVGLAFAACAQAQHYNDGLGKEWRSVPTTTGLSWIQVASVCPTDGVTPCAGTVSGRDMNGWRWATQDQVRGLFATFAPEIVQQSCVGGPQYAAVGIYMLGGGVIAPTWAAYTTFGGSLYVNGWTATRSAAQEAFLASASGNYPVFDGSMCVLGRANTASFINYTGVWMWRPIGCELPVQVVAPTTVAVCQGGRAEFLVDASSTSAITFQWRRDGAAIDSQDNATAATASLVINGVTSSDVGAYDCVLINSCGAVLSSRAMLVVEGSCCDDVDFNNNGVFPEDLDILDFFAVLAGASCESCNDVDFNNNGVYPEDADILSFFAVLAGDVCE